jgi:membrane protease YdiL (CAAX protease family)
MSDQPSMLPGVIPDRMTARTGLARTAVAVSGIVSAALVTNLVATLVAASVVGSDVSQMIPFAAVMIASELALLTTGVAYLRFQSSLRLPVRIPTRQSVPYVIGGLVAGFGTVFLQLAITDAIVPMIELSPGFTEYSNLGRVTGSGLIVGAVLSLVLVAPIEEFLFRGVIQGRMLEALGSVGAVGVASVVFAFFHVYPVALLSPPTVVIIHMTSYYTVMGVIFGWAYHRTDTLVAPVVVHGIFNAVLFASPLLG